MQVTVLNNQTLFDVAIAFTGVMESSMAIAFENDIAITQELIPGQILSIPTSIEGEADIVKYFNENNLKPATALTDADFAIIEIENCNLCNCFK